MTEEEILKQKIVLATQLRYWDDAKHWTRELQKLRQKNREKTS